MKTNKSHIFATLIIMPIIYFIVSFLFFRGNYEAYDYVDTYIANSNVIELTLPRYDSIEINAKSYTYKLVKGPSGTKTYYQTFFYSNKYNKYLAIISFKGFDLDKEFNNFDLETERVTKMYSYQPTIFAYSNRAQWSDAKYGTKEYPMPIFVIKITALNNGKHILPDIDEHGFQKKECNLREKIINKYVEQYLAYFLSTGEFKRLFEKNK